MSVSSRLSRRLRTRVSTSAQLPHWSEVDSPTPSSQRRSRPSPTMAELLRDLVGWAADIAIVLTRGCPEDRAAIERVRCYSYAWLLGEALPDVALEDVLTTVAALMAGIDRNIGGTVDESDEGGAVGAEVSE